MEGDKQTDGGDDNDEKNHITKIHIIIIILNQSTIYQIKVRKVGGPRARLLKDLKRITPIRKNDMYMYTILVDCDFFFTSFWVQIDHGAEVRLRYSATNSVKSKLSARVDATTRIELCRGVI